MRASRASIVPPQHPPPEYVHHAPIRRAAPGSVAQLEAHPTLNRDGEGSIPSGPTGEALASPNGRARPSPRVRPRRALARRAPGSSSGRTLVSDSSDTGSNPVPGTDGTCTHAPSLSDNLAPMNSSRTRDALARTNAPFGRRIFGSRSPARRASSLERTARPRRVFLPAKPNGQAPDC